MDQIFDNKNISEEEINKEVLEIEKYLNSSQSQDLVLSIVKPITDYRNNFNEFEGNILTELLNATNKLEQKHLGQIKMVINCRKFIEDIELQKLRLIDLDDKVKQMVKISQNLKAFHDISNEDRIALIKYGFIEVNNIIRIKNSELKLEKWTLCNVGEYIINIIFFMNFPFFYIFH